MPRLRRAWIALPALWAAFAAAPAAADAATPDPGGDSLANVRLPPPGGKLFGVNGTFELPGVRAEQFVGSFARSGFNSVRRTLSWWSVEPARDQWSNAGWASAGAFYDAALSDGMTPVFNIGFAPPWARPLSGQFCPAVGICELPPAPSMNGEWAEFAAEAARRFPKAIFEIWNEPNTPDFWESGPNPERWAELVVIAHDAIKGVNRKIPIIVCGCAGVRPKARDAVGMEIGEFLGRAYRHTPSIRDHFDGISFHFYPQGYHPYRPFKFGPGSALADIIWRVRHVAAAHGDRGVGLWIDEIGYWTADGPEASGREIVTEAEAAKGLTKLARRLLTMKDVRAVMIHREIDGPGGDNRFAVRDASFGLLRRFPLLQPKPSYCRFAAMAGRFKAPGCREVEPPSTKILDVDRSLVPRLVTITLGVDERPQGARFECRLGRGGWKRCPRKVVLRGLRAGAYRFKARAYRDDGTHDPKPAVARFLIKNV